MGNDPSYFLFTVSCKQLGDQPARSCSLSQQFSVAKIISDVWKAYQFFRGGRANLPQGFPLAWIFGDTRKQAPVSEPPTDWLAQPQGTALAAFVRSQNASSNPQNTVWSLQEPGGEKERTFDLCLPLVQTKEWHLPLWRPQGNIFIGLI